MGKTKRSFHEYTKEQELTHENKMLKEEVARLKKLLARSDVGKEIRPKERRPAAAANAAAGTPDHSREKAEVFDPICEEFRLTQGTTG